ncbi:MAG: DoxX family protein [bacterium]
MKRLFHSTVSSFQINLSLLILRLGIGTLMLTHGWPKVLRLTGSEEIVFPDPLGMGPVTSLVMAILAEVGSSLLIILGLATRLAAFSLLFTMLVAVFIVHAGDPFARMEMGLLYLLVYVVLFVTGSGKYGLDRFVR